MDKELKLYSYIDGVNDVPFPSSEDQSIITSFQYDSKRMGGAPTISAAQRKRAISAWIYLLTQRNALISCGRIRYMLHSMARNTL